MRGPLVVQGERLVGGIDAEDEVTGGNLDRRSGDAGSAARQRCSGAQQRCPGAHGQCLQHGLVVLVLVADHQRKAELVVLVGGVEDIKGLAPNGLQIPVCLRRGEQRQIHRLARECTKAS